MTPWTWFAILATASLGYVALWCIVHVKVTPVLPQFLDRMLLKIFRRIG